MLGMMVAIAMEAVSLAGQLKLLRMGQEVCMSLILAITVCVSLMTARDSFCLLPLNLVIKKDAASKQLKSFRDICVGSDQFVYIFDNMNNCVSV